MYISVKSTQAQRPCLQVCRCPAASPGGVFGFRSRGFKGLKLAGKSGFPHNITHGGKGEKIRTRFTQRDAQNPQPPNSLSLLLTASRGLGV